MELLGNVWDLLLWLGGRAFGSERLQYVLAFAVCLLLFDVVRRGFRIVWPAGKIRSVAATAGIFGLNLLLGPFAALLAASFQAAYDVLKLPQVDPGFWAGVSPWVLTPLAVFLYDVANYWSHRVMHMGWLWPIHAVHHSDTDMTGLTSYRVHILEPVLMMTTYTLLLSWIGFPPDVLGGAAVFLGLLNFYVHTEVDWGHGPFRLLLASPRYHRWHHADTPEAYGKNLANVFPFLDVAFGTYHVPGHCTVAMGARGVPAHDVVRLMLWPFTQWTQMIRRRLRKRLSGPAVLEMSEA